MQDLISRKSAIEAIERNAYRHTYLEQILDIIKSMPSAHPLNPCETCLHKGKGWDEDPCDGCTGTESKYEPERKKGKWEVAIGYDPKRSFMCDQCHRMAYEPSAYCPNCGSYNGGGDE